MSEQEPIKSVSKPGETKVLITSTLVRGVDIYHFPSVSDPRGDLTVGEFDRGFPFRPKRYFIISGVPSSNSGRACSPAMSSISYLRLWTMQRHS